MAPQREHGRCWAFQITLTPTRSGSICFASDRRYNAAHASLHSIAVHRGTECRRILLARGSRESNNASRLAGRRPGEPSGIGAEHLEPVNPKNPVDRIANRRWLSSRRAMTWSIPKTASICISISSVRKSVPRCTSTPREGMGLVCAHHRIQWLRGRRAARSG